MKEDPHAKIIPPKTAVCIGNSKGFQTDPIAPTGKFTLALWSSIENRGSFNRGTYNQQGNKDCQLSCMSLPETISYIDGGTLNFFGMQSRYDFLFTLFLSQIGTKLNMLHNSHTCNASTCFSLIVFMSVSGCMWRERERERESVECGDSFRSNCVELDSTQECTKRLDFFCCIVSRKLIKCLTQYCTHESHVSVKWPTRNVFRRLCEVERLFWEPVRYDGGHSGFFFLHLSARTLLNVIQDHFDDLDKGLVFELMCFFFVFFLICLVGSYLFIFCVCLCGLILSMFFQSSCCIVQCIIPNANPVGRVVSTTSKTCWKSYFLLLFSF